MTPADWEQWRKQQLYDKRMMHDFYLGQPGDW